MVNDQHPSRDPFPSTQETACVRKPRPTDTYSCSNTTEVRSKRFERPTTSSDSNSNNHHNHNLKNTPVHVIHTCGETNSRGSWRSPHAVAASYPAYRAQRLGCNISSSGSPPPTLNKPTNYRRRCCCCIEDRTRFIVALGAAPGSSARTRLLSSSFFYLLPLSVLEENCSVPLIPISSP